jgi:DNA-binding CsgD family transcriptional regulator
VVLKRSSEWIMPQVSDSNPPLAITGSAVTDAIDTACQIDPFDCFNDDLVFIIDRLVERTSGSFGLVSRHVLGSSAAALARTTTTPSGSEQLVQPLAVLAYEATNGDRRRRSDLPALSQRSWQPEGILFDGTTYRVLSLVFYPTQNVTIVATVCRANGMIPFSALDETIASKLYSVLSRYVRLWWMHRQERRRADSLSAALNLSDLGVMMLDRRAALVFANARAEIFLGQQDGVQRHDESIAATQPEDGARLQAAMQHAIHCNLTTGANSEDQQPSPVIALRRRNGRRPLLLTVINMERPALDLRDPAVIIYLLDPEQNVEQLLAPVCEMYKLTPAETRLVLQLVSGWKLSDAAERMQIRLETARAYLKQVFAKTMTNRQADLMRIMLSSLLRTTIKVDLGLL